MQPKAKLFNLTSAEHLYILFDGTLIPDLPNQIENFHDTLVKIPLYEGTTLHHLKELSPWLIELPTQRTSSIIEWALTMKYFENAAWMFSSYENYSNVVSKFRKLLFVKHPDGGDYIFRIHDPRIAYPLLKSHKENTTSGLIEELNTAWFNQADDWKCIEFSTDKNDNLKKFEQYCLNKTDISILSEVTMVEFRNRLRKHIQKYFPFWDKKKSRMSTLEIIKSAKEYGFNSERSIFFFSNVLGYLDEEYIQNFKYKDITQLLTKPSQLTPEQRVEKAAKLAYQYNQGANNGY